MGWVLAGPGQGCLENAMLRLLLPKAEHSFLSANQTLEIWVFLFKLGCPNSGQPAELKGVFLCGGLLQVTKEGFHHMAFPPPNPPPLKKKNCAISSPWPVEFCLLSQSVFGEEGGVG